MTAPSFVLVLSPHQNAFFTELADVLEIDPIAAARAKIAKNALKYPAPGA